MEVIYGMAAALCFYLVFGSLKLYWQRWQAGEAILPGSVERQTFWLSLFMAGLGVILVLRILGIVRFI